MLFLTDFRRGLLLWDSLTRLMLSRSITPVWCIGTVDNSMIAGRKVVTLSGGIFAVVVRSFSYRHVLIFKIGADLGRSLAIVRQNHPQKVSLLTKANE